MTPCKARAQTYVPQCSSCGSVFKDGAFRDTLNGKLVCKTCMDRWIDIEKATVTEVLKGPKI